MEFSRKKENKLYKIYVNHVTKLTSLVLNNEDVESISEDFVKKVGEDCADMMGDFVNFMKGFEGEMGDKDFRKVESILAESVLKISSYVESFTPNSKIMSKISIICVGYMIKTDIKKRKWSTKS
jgi:hypothetical protein